MSDRLRINRREFLQVLGAGSAGLTLGVFRLAPALAQDGSQVFKPNEFLSIDSDGTVTLWVARSEMGQGARTTVPMMVAEQLEADWEKIRIMPAVAHPSKYGSMSTGGSTTVRRGWEPLCKAGAAAREMLISAAAQIWAVDRAGCKAENGMVIHVPSGRKLGYGELAATAANLPVPAEVKLKDPKDYKIVGKQKMRLDTPEKLTGKAVFGFDFMLPGLAIAVIARPPVLGGKVKRWDDQAAGAIQGVKQVIEVSHGLAVVADSTWAALQGREKLVVEWDEGENAKLDSAAIRQYFIEKSKEPGKSARSEGDVAAALQTAVKRIEAQYEVPFISHSPMEPMNCVADVRSDRVEIWAPTQNPQSVQSMASELTGVAMEQVFVNTTLMGGGFGRRLMADYAEEAVELSKLLQAPVKVVWTREDDLQHGYFRPGSFHVLEGAVDAQNQPVVWKHRIAAPSISGQLYPQQPPRGNPDLVDGAAQLPYRISNLLVDYVMANTALPITWLRSVYNSANAFVNESFLDELAHAAGQDPLAFRLSLLPPDHRLRGVLQLAAEKAGWSEKLPRGKGRGIACHACFGSYAAHVAEVTVTRDGRLTLDRFLCAIDCGQAVHPEGIRQQMEGGVIFSLSVAMREAITVQNGGVVQQNFDTYEPLRIHEIPARIEVYIAENNLPPGGVGEPGVPPVAPALCNAIFAACGVRVRRLPVSENDLRWS